MKNYFLTSLAVSFILGFVFGLADKAAAANASGRNQLAPMAPAVVAEPANAQTMAQKLQQYNEMSERVHEHRFRGGADEDQLKVLPQLPKPEHGVIGNQMQAQDNQEHSEESAGEPQHD